MKLELHKEDLMSLGEGFFNQDGYVSILMAGLSTRGMAWEREIIIRNVLKLFGDQYKVLGMTECELDSDIGCDLDGAEPPVIYLITNLPWSMIEDYLHDHKSHY